MAKLIPGAVTIGIPTLNRRHLLQRAVESALAQTYTALQIVIADDGSVDGTADYLNQLTDPRIVILRHPTHRGMVENFNACFAVARGEFILMLNDDDWLLPTAIEKLVHGFLHPPEGIAPSDIGVSWCPFTNVTEDGTALWTVRGGPPLERSVNLIRGLFNGTRGPICSSCLLRTADVLATRGYEDRFGHLSDSGLLGKACLRSPYAVCVDEPLMHYLVHQTSPCSTALADSTVWQNYIRLQADEFCAILHAQQQHADADLLRRAASHALANITASILLRSFGSPGWIRRAAQELWHSRSFMLTPFVLKRVLLDGHKLLRLRSGFSAQAFRLKLAARLAHAPVDLSPAPAEPLS
jgi:glycosyltransferase involved in cell wall biosynthesis